MKLGDLIKKMKPFDPEKEIVLSRDEEGNGFGSIGDGEDFYMSCFGYDEENDRYVLYPFKELD